MPAALFLDRDGVINIDHGYVGRPEEFEVMPGVEEFLRAAQAAGYLLIIITNQSGIARGYFSAEDYAALETHLLETFSARGIAFADIYHCPHHPDGKVPQLSVACSCRKPSPELIQQAARDHAIDLAASIFVGDKRTDIMAAEAAGVGKAFLVVGKPHVGQQEFARIAAAFR